MGNHSKEGKNIKDIKGKEPVGNELRRYGLALIVAKGSRSRAKTLIVAKAIVQLNGRVTP